MRLPAPSLGSRVTLRQLGSQSSVLISIAIAILISSLSVALAPRLLETVAEEDLLNTLTEPPPAQRNIRVERFGRIGAGPGDDPFRAVRQFGDHFLETTPDAIAAIVEDQTYVVDSPRFSIFPMPGEDPPHPFRMFIRFRHQQGIEERTQLVQGAMPVPQEPVPMLVGADCPVDADEREELFDEIESNGPIEDLECDIAEVPHFQVAVSQGTAEALGIDLGRQMRLRPDPSDRLFFGITGNDLAYDLVVSISGIVEFDDPAEEYWYGDDSLHRPAIQENADLRIIFATGLMAPDDYRSMFDATGEAQRNYVWRYFIDPDAVVAADTSALLTELRSFEIDFSPIAARPTDPTVLTQLSDLLEEHLSQRAETIAMLSMAVLGVLTSVVAVVLLGAILMTFRQRQTIGLVRGRGASRGQLTISRLYQSLLIAVPAGAAGYGIAWLALPDTDDAVPYRAVVALVGAATAVLTFAISPALSSPLRDILGERRGLPRSGPRRIVFEALVLVVTVGAVLTVRRRGQSDSPPDQQFDLLLALTPALISVLGGLVALRMYRPLSRLLARIGAMARGLVSFVGLRRVLQLSYSATLPVLVIVVCVGIATLTSIMRDTIGDGQEMSSWQIVGADYKIEGFARDVNIPTAVDIDAVLSRWEGAVGKSFVESRAVTPDGRVPAFVLAVDDEAHGDLLSDTPANPQYPGFLGDAPSEGLGSNSNPIPVIVSADWPSTIELAVGDRFRLDLADLDPEVVVAEVRSRHPGAPTDLPFVIMSLEHLSAMTDLSLRPTVVYLRTGPDEIAAIEEEVRSNPSSARLTSRYSELAAIAEDPFIEWSSWILGALFVLSGAFAVVAALTSLAITSSSRHRDLSYLATLGLTGRQARSATLIEQTPSIIVGTLFGLGTGVLAAFLVQPALGLGAFTGPTTPSTLSVEWAVLAWLGLALLVAMTMGVGIFLYVVRRRELGETMRLGDV